MPSLLCSMKPPAEHSRLGIFGTVGHRLILERLSPRLSNAKILSSSLFQEVGLNTFRPGPNVKLGSKPFQYQPVAYSSEDAKSAMLGGWFHRLFQNKPPPSMYAPQPEFSSFFELLRGTLHEFPII